MGVSGIKKRTRIKRHVQKNRGTDMTRNGLISSSPVHMDPFPSPPVQGALITTPHPAHPFISTLHLHYEYTSSPQKILGRP